MHTTRRRVFDGQRWSVERVTVHKPDGSTAERDYIVHPGSVVLVPVLDDGRVVLIRNWRHSLRRTLWELPAGTIEPAGEEPLKCAGRELIEETGYEAATIAPLLSFFAAPGLADEHMRAYLCTGLRHVGQSTDDAEHIVVEPVTADEAVAMIGDGRIVDAKTIAVLLWWRTFARQDQRDF